MSYNERANYETWVVRLWFEGFWDERAEEIAGECEEGLIDDWEAIGTLAREIRELVEEYNPVAEEASMYSDLMGAALQEVNWVGLARTYLDEYCELCGERA